MDSVDRLRILLIGNGGREHALAWKLSQSPRVDSIYVVPGNGGTGHGLKKVENVDTVRADDFPGLVAFAEKKNINLVVPGPEATLVAGIESHFRKGKCKPCPARRHLLKASQAGIRCFGPTKDAARMEGSKAFAKDFMARWNIPTADSQTFSKYEQAKSYVDSVAHKIVIKADGLYVQTWSITPSPA